MQIDKSYFNKSICQNKPMHLSWIKLSVLPFSKCLLDGALSISTTGILDMSRLYLYLSFKLYFFMHHIIYLLLKIYFFFIWFFHICIFDAFGDECFLKQFLLCLYIRKFFLYFYLQ